jgi:dTDP-4-dehydrorhamnose reductase
MQYEYLVLGSRGLVGSAISRRLQLLGRDFYPATRADADITNPVSINQ